MRDENGESKGWGFVRYESDAVVTKVLNTNHELNGRGIIVKISEKFRSGDARMPFPQHRNVGDKPPPRMRSDKATLFVANIEWNTTDEEFKTYFQKFGPTSQCKIMRDEENGRGRGFGFVTYVNDRDRDTVLLRQQTQQNTLKGRELSIRLSRPRMQDDGNMENFMQNQQTWEGGGNNNVENNNTNHLVNQLAALSVGDNNPAGFQGGLGGLGGGLTGGLGGGLPGGGL